MEIANASGSGLNTTLEDYEQVLKEVSDKYAMALIPVVVVLVVLLVLGLVGNPLVIYFFGFRMKTSVSFMFIVTLAVFDFLSCIFTIPLEILDIVYFYTFPSPGVCRTFRFISYVLSIASCTTLVAIAADRFNKVCRPFNNQITTKRAPYVIIGVLMFSLLSSGPSVVFNDVVRVNISDHEEIIGLDCTITSEHSYRLYIAIYNGYLLLFFIAFFLILIIVYSLVGKKLKLGQNKFDPRQNSNKKFVMKKIEDNTASTKSSMDDLGETSTKDVYEIFSQNKNNCKLNSSSNDTYVNKISTNRIVRHHNRKSEVDTDDKVLQNNTQMAQRASFLEVRSGECEIRDEKDHGSAYTQYTSKVTSVKESLNKQTKTLQKRSIKTRRFTIIAISISLAFIISYLPYLVLSVRTIFVGYDPNLLSPSQLLFCEFFYRSYVINNVCNPIIYGLFNSKFKQMVCNIFGRLLCCERCSKKLAPKCRFNENPE